MNASYGKMLTFLIIKIESNQVIGWEVVKNYKKLHFLAIDNKNFTNDVLLPWLASSLFDNAVKMLYAQAQARALPEQH